MPTSMRTTLTALCLLAAPAAAGEGPSFAIRAARVHADGNTLENAVVLVRDGEIAEVGTDVAVPEELVTVEHDGDLSAGLVALRDYSGIEGEGRDSTRSVLASADLAHAFDPDHSDMQRLIEEGVTTVVLVPRSGSLVGGQCAVVKPGARVLRRNALLHVDLGSSALSSNSFPTSYAGALEELERCFAKTEGPFADARAGSLKTLLQAGDRAEAARAIAFARQHGLKGVLAGAGRAGELAEDLAAAGLGVVLEPFRPGTSRHVLASAARLADAGVPIAFALDAPGDHPATLRLTAAAYVRAGLDPEAARRAMTSGAAELAGVGDEVGSVRPGCDADLVLWSGDPVDPGSRIVAVYVDGELVHGDPTKEKDEEDDDGGDE